MKSAAGEIVMTAAPAIARAQFSIERTYAASIDETWALWTTKAGIESWWGPEGFDVTVISLDLRPGGQLVARCLMLVAGFPALRAHFDVAEESGKRPRA
jgi:uncharacterized protein YndB with AHSA1/START domain